MAPANRRTTPGPLANATRRRFIQGSGLMLAGGAIAGGQLPIARGAHAFGSDLIRIGLVGCGSRGTTAAIQALGTQGGAVRLTALADVFASRVQTAFRSIKGKHADKVSVEDRRFVGLDAYRQLLATDVDLVILATPPGFRPLQFESAIHAGKHVFMEKPVAVDAPGVRRVLAANQLAKERGLAVQVGLQRRHESRYRECIERLQDGAIGDPLFARVYWNGAGSWAQPRSPEQSELEHQLRNWHFFNWLSGDHITEQHVHNLDVINWLLDSHPIECQGQGGREVRRGPEHGQIFDHHMVEYTYENHVRLLSQCRHMQGCWNSVGEHVHGTAGHCDIGNAVIYDRGGKVRWQSDAKEPRGKGWQQEQDDLFAALRRGEAPNEADFAATSTMTAIMGRMATYGGKVVRWNDAINSHLTLADVDQLRSLDAEAPLPPDDRGDYPVPVPGQSRAI